MSGGQSLPYANFGKRALAALIDGVLISVLVVMVVALGVLSAIWGAHAAGSDPGLRTWLPLLVKRPIFLLLAVTVPFLYVWIPEGKWGATPGKKMLGIRLVDAETGGRVGYLRVIGRNLASKVCKTLFIAHCIDSLWSVHDQKRQTVRDKVFGTVVVDTRGATSIGNEVFDTISEKSALLKQGARQVLNQRPAPQFFTAAARLPDQDLPPNR